MRAPLLALLAIVLCAAVPEPEGYRLDDYNVPVPETLAGARVVDAPALAKAIAAGAIAIDVLPAPRRPPGQPDNQPWLPRPRMDVPGSLWWPEVGRGAIPPALDAWFRQRLTDVTGGNPDRALAFYCKAACWMSWNAAKRAVDYGYHSVLWFPGGAEAWTAAGYPLQQGVAETVPVNP